MSTFKIFVLVCLAVVTGLIIIPVIKTAFEPSNVRPVTLADYPPEMQAERDRCISEQHRLLVTLVDKPWRTSELVYEAGKLCDRKGIYQPR